MKKIIYYCGVALLTFLCVASVWFVMKNKKPEEEILGDIKEYVFFFDEVTIPNKKLVIFDNRDLYYLKYYVTEFTGQQYVTYCYYFMGDHDKYIDKYKEVVDLIVDYNYKEYMIKTIETINYGTYDEFLLSMQDVLDNDLMYIIY